MFKMLTEVMILDYLTQRTMKVTCDFIDHETKWKIIVFQSHNICGSRHGL